MTVWPVSFTVGLATSNHWRGSGQLLVAPGSLVCTPGPITGRVSGVGGIAHTGTQVDLYVSKLVPPWFNISVPVRGSEATVVASTWIFARRNLRDTLRAAGFQVTEHVGWIHSYSR